MSIEATLDLRATASPRSLCVFPASEYAAVGGTSTTTNPFDSSTDVSSSANAMAVVFGSDRGSLHYRTYAPPSRWSRQASLSTATASTIQRAPLGTTAPGSATSKSTNLPRGYLPIDFVAVNGPVVSVVKLSKQYCLLLVDDNRGTSAAQPGAYAAVIVMQTPNSYHTVIHTNTLPRMSCAAYHPTVGLLYGAGRSIQVVGPELWEEEIKRGSRYSNRKRLMFGSNVVPSPGVRSGQDALAITANGKVVVTVVGNTFYAIYGQQAEEQGPTPTPECFKLISFVQSSQVHPVVVLDMEDMSLKDTWSSLFLASGRECAVVDLDHGSPPILSASKPRQGTVTLASPILTAAASWPWVVVLTSDGLISIRSPSCLAITLRTVCITESQTKNQNKILAVCWFCLLRSTCVFVFYLFIYLFIFGMDAHHIASLDINTQVEVGQRPNDFFVMRTIRDDAHHTPWIVALAYSGECKVLQCQPDTAQDLADRLMRLAIDAFSVNGFPRAELAEAVNASFTATSYVGTEPTVQSRNLLKQYLEAILGVADFEAGASSGWPTELAKGSTAKGTFGDEKAKVSGRGAQPTMLSSSSPGPLMCGTALLCLVCSQLSPPNSTLASRVAKKCSDTMGIVFDSRSDVPYAAAYVCEVVAEKLLREAASNFSLLTSGPTAAPFQRMHRNSYATFQSEFIEASIWLLRTAGKHERAIEVADERLLHSTDGTSSSRGSWSQIKYDSYIATHLSELWCSKKEEGYSLVLHSPAMSRLLENNPRLGVSVFTSTHPQNESQWRSMLARDDPLAQPQHVYEVLKLLKSSYPAVPYDKEKVTAVDDDVLPLESGRALAVAFLESAVGIITGRPTESDEFENLPVDEKFEGHVANFHDELSFLLLEGVISERTDDVTEDEDTPLGKIYRSKLRNFLKWPLARIRPERFMDTLPSSFLEEKALILGRIGRHEDALRILYHDLKDLELALEYCDDRYEQQKVQQERRRARQHRLTTMEYKESSGQDEDNAYLPLIRVALDSDDKDRGIAAAIQVLALRRGAIDRAAALRLLPSGVPVAAVARPFLIPALVDSESQVRRLTVVSALLRARYLRLKEELTLAQLKAQSSLTLVPQLRTLNLNEPLHSSKAFRARTSAAASANMPDLMITKHFFPNYLVIQAKVTNTTGGGANTDYSISGGKVARVLSDIAFIVAESSEEAIQPLLQVPIVVLPPGMTGCAWCVLEAHPSRMDGSTAQLTCELRYTVQSIDGGQSLAIPGFMGTPPGAVSTWKNFKILKYMPPISRKTTNTKRERGRNYL